MALDDSDRDECFLHYLIVSQAFPNMQATSSPISHLVMENAKALGWESYLPFLTDTHITEFETTVDSNERTELARLFAIDDIINAKPGRRVLATSLFWKHAGPKGPPLPKLSLEILREAKKLGLAVRADPWTHYVLPLLRGAALLHEEFSDLAIRVYLAKDLDFLVPELVKTCEVVLMKHSSLQHNPGAMWRFLAMEDGPEVVTITDADRMVVAARVQCQRSRRVINEEIATWRCPRFHEINRRGRFNYRPIVACGFGTRIRLPVRQLARAFVWQSQRAAFPRQIASETLGPLRHCQQVWPSYGMAEWFLSTAVYPRLLPFGMATFPHRCRAPNLFPLDVELVRRCNFASYTVFPNG